MSTYQAETYKEHPMFRLAMQNLQQGEWDDGLGKLDTLMQAYPLEGSCAACARRCSCERASTRTSTRSAPAPPRRLRI
jgi:hypothetical protein